MERLIFLVGFMGCGKTYWGARLAEDIGYQFLDLDQLIVLRSGKTIPEIFEQDGEPEFRRMEQKYLRALSDNSNNWVVATGGGAPCFGDNMDWMNENGLTLWLNVPVTILAERLGKEREKRPLLIGIGDSELEGFISAKLEERLIFYQKARHVVRWQANELDFWEHLRFFVYPTQSGSLKG